MQWFILHMNIDKTNKTEKNYRLSEDNDDMQCAVWWSTVIFAGNWNRWLGEVSLNVDDQGAVHCAGESLPSWNSLMFSLHVKLDFFFKCTQYKNKLHVTM